MASIRFLGAAGTVTGSRYLIRAHGRQILVDAGLFQGSKELRLRNWAPFPVEPRDIDAIVLTHAHIDHTGALPLLTRTGFKGPIYCTPATRDLAQLLLPDSGRLQEEEARYANKKGTSKHAPDAKPLYGEADAIMCLRQLVPLNYHTQREILPGFTVNYTRAGHILGSASIEMVIAPKGDEPGARVLFSGDVGRYAVPILPDPEPAPAADEILVECTYGDRLHGDESPTQSLEREIHEAVKRGGAIIIPSFAVGRTQEILFNLRELEAKKAIPELQVFVDSPMAVDATPIYLAHREDHDDEMSKLIASGVEPLRPARLAFTRSPEQSKAINRVKGPCIILSASGMATGGRILHHLANRLPDERNTVLLVGFQAVGTRGSSLQNGAETLRIYGVDVPVKAKVATISGFSAHGDKGEIDRWLATLPSPPKRVFCVHGEPGALAATATRLEAQGWKATVPQHLQEIQLGA